MWKECKLTKKAKNLKKVFFCWVIIKSKKDSMAQLPREDGATETDNEQKQRS